jgi:hypothetical protein
MTVLYNELTFTCNRGLALQDELLNLYKSNRLTTLASNTFGELKRVGFNANSGNVWLEDEDYNCLMVNGEELDLFISTPYSGIEGFLSDILAEYDLDEIASEDKEYLEDLKASIA